MLSQIRGSISWKFTPSHISHPSVIASASAKPSKGRTRGRKASKGDRLARRLEEALSVGQTEPELVEESTTSKTTDPELDEESTTSKTTDPTPLEPVFQFRIQKFKRKRQGEFFYDRSFEDVGMREELIEALAFFKITQPSQIQGLAFEAVEEFGFQRSLLLADQAGSGKTLAYLGPVVQKLRFEEEQLKRRLTTSGQPRALIIVPTAELAVQVLQLCRSIARTCPFRSIAITGGRPWSTQTEALKEGVDVVICTPSRLVNHLEAGSLDLENCNSIVLDEVDILLGSGSDFRESTMKILEFVAEGTQFFLATATIPEHIYSDLTDVFEELAVVLGPGLHCTAPGVSEQLVDCSGGEIINEETGQKRKAQAAFSLIKSNKFQRTVIFCNKIETCRMIENYLKRHDKREEEYRVLAYHAAVVESTRNQNLKIFLNEANSKPMILVSTDRASRGLDTFNVSHVILFDFPRDPSEYVRRVGRTARGAKSEGLVSILVLGRQVSFARAVLMKSKKGLPVHKTPHEDTV